MLNVSDLTYKIGARTILDECNVTIMDNWKVGVVGLNGAGKSTLFKLIAGDLIPDGGTVEKNSKQRMGMVRQDNSVTRHALHGFYRIINTRAN